VDTWLVRVVFPKGEPIQAVVSTPEWTPDQDTWRAFKARSTAEPARVTVLGVAAESPGTIRAAKSITLTTSADPVGAPLFYREVPLPFIDAVKDPGRIRWRFGSIDSRARPPVVLENLPVCGNCHSFSSDGRVLGMDVDYANDKGSYVLSETAPEMVLSKSSIINWSDFRRRDKQLTFGLLSQVSPDGRYAISTVKDRSVFVPKPDLDFSQLFFPLQGILAFYDREQRTFHPLPGADDPAYVQSNPVWSPDGKYVVFARSRAYQLKYLKGTTTALLSPEECREFLQGGQTFQFDLYRVPFNQGKGGKAVPLAGASGNGQSNFFARYSPDGKWIVFCRAKSFMLLQPDSELYVIPADGGEARRLGCNTNRMNSWHSWSPNGRWLVFASKASTPYTQLWLAHMDERAESAPPIVLSQLTAPDRAANIPEFVNLPPNAIARIREEFVNDESYLRTAAENLKAQDPKGAATLYRKALGVNPNNVAAHAFLGGILTDSGQLEEAHQHLAEALRLDPKNVDAHYYLGNALAKQKRYDVAIQAWKRAIELDPKHSGAQSNLGGVLVGLGRLPEAEKVLGAAVAADPNDPSARNNLGSVLSKLGRREAAVRQWREAVRLDDQLFEAHQSLGTALLEAGDFDGALQHLGAALRLDPNNVPSMLDLATAHARKGDVARAVQVTERAAKAARMTGRADLFEESERRLAQYRGEPPRR
jgi:tetratricopeptide (TPR) repeat protein